MTTYDIPLMQHDDGTWSSGADYWNRYQTAAEALASGDQYVRWLIRARQGSGILRALAEETGAEVYRQILRDYAAYRAPRPTETCTRCGDARDLFCVMSDDGEGPHDIVPVIAVTDDDVELARRLDVHHEQGSQER